MPLFFSTRFENFKFLLKTPTKCVVILVVLPLGKCSRSVKFCKRRRQHSFKRGLWMQGRGRWRCVDSAESVL